MEVPRQVKYERELNPAFTAWVTSVPGGEHIRECIQCGTCSSICPLSVYMDISPRRIIAMVDAGFKNEVLGSKTIWLCASCYACSVECPKDIKITDVMYALKRKAIEEKTPSKGNFIPLLAHAFADMVRKYGRATESRLAMRIALRAGISRGLRMASLGLRMMRTGRMRLAHEKVHNRSEIKKMLKAAEMEP